MPRPCRHFLEPIKAPRSKLQGIFDPHGSSFMLIARSWIHDITRTWIKQSPELQNMPVIA
jgi:hypothetical protein